MPNNRSHAAGSALVLLVPDADRERCLGLKPASAVCAIEDDWQRLVDGLTTNCEVHYEGGLYHQAMSFQDKLFGAGGRLLERYPTAARTWVPSTEGMTVVATFSLTPRAMRVVEAG